MLLVSSALDEVADYIGVSRKTRYANCKTARSTSPELQFDWYIGIVACMVITFYDYSKLSERLWYYETQVLQYSPLMTKLFWYGCVLKLIWPIVSVDGSDEVLRMDTRERALLRCELAIYLFFITIKLLQVRYNLVLAIMWVLSQTARTKSVAEREIEELMAPVRVTVANFFNRAIHSRIS